MLLGSSEQRWRGFGSASLAPHQCGLGSIPGQCHKWVEFVGGRRFALWDFLPKTDISKFQFEQDRAPAWEPAETDLTFSLNIVIHFICTMAKMMMPSNSSLLAGAVCH